MLARVVDDDSPAAGSGAAVARRKRAGRPEVGQAWCIGRMTEKIQSLTKELVSRDVGRRLSAADTLCRLVQGAEEAHIIAEMLPCLRALGSCIRDEDAGICSAALGAFRNIAESGRAQAVSAQITELPCCLRSADVSIRRKACSLCRCLAESGEASCITRFVPQLVECLEATEPVLRVAPLDVFCALVDFGEVKAVVQGALLPILQSFRDENPLVRVGVLEALAAIVRQDSASILHKLADANCAMPASNGQRDKESIESSILDMFSTMLLDADIETKSTCKRLLTSMILSDPRRVAASVDPRYQAWAGEIGELEVREAIQAMFQRNDRSGLRGLFELFRQQSSVIAHLQELMALHAESRCELVLADSGDAVRCIEEVLAIKDDLDVTVTTCFFSDAACQRARDRGVETALNKDTRCAKYLALFCDFQLRKALAERSDEEVMKLAAQVTGIFAHLRDKDIFLSVYKRALARRLLNRLSLSNSAEAIFLEKLKAECGQQAVQSMTTMFADITISGQLQAEYTSHRLSHKSPQSEINHEVRVLQKNSWPEKVDDSNILPCESMLLCTQAFESFYHMKYSGRRLRWLYGMGAAEVLARCFHKKHILSMSTLQCVVLMLFNRWDKISCKEICEATNIPREECKRQLTSLALGKHLLLVHSDPSRQIDDEGTFTVNVDFNSERTKVTLAPAAARKQDRVDEVAAEAPSERKQVVDAAIVRIMKCKRRLDHNALLQEVFRQCKLFTPQPQQVKERVGVLIQREFLGPDSDAQDTYMYLP